MAAIDYAFVQQIVFNTSAERLAYVFVQADVGKTIAFDASNNVFYFVKAAGSGVACFSPLTSATNEQGSIGLSLHSFRECDGNSDVGNIAANGGILASDTTPIMRGRATVNNQEIAWASSNNDAIVTEVGLPTDFDGSRTVTIELIVQGGTTDLASFVTASTWDGGTEVAGVVTDATLSASDHTITGTLVPGVASPKHLSLRLTPAAHTTDTKVLAGVRITYFRK